MTHSLHREGTRASLAADYVVMALGKDRRRLVAPKAQLSRALPRVYRFIKNGLRAVGLEWVLRAARVYQHAEQFPWTVVLHSKDELTRHLLLRKRAAAGQSVVVSGLVDQVTDSLETVGLRPHTVQLSLGRFGSVERLPEPEVLAITSMCGHHLVAPSLVRKLRSDVARGKISAREAARAMGAVCQCAIFNEERAAALLGDQVKSDED